MISSFEPPVPPATCVPKSGLPLCVSSAALFDSGLPPAGCSSSSAASAPFDTAAPSEAAPLLPGGSPPAVCPGSLFHGVDSGSSLQRGPVGANDAKCGLPSSHIRADCTQEGEIVCGIAFSVFWDAASLLCPFRTLPRSGNRGPSWRVWPMPLPFPQLHCPEIRKKDSETSRRLALNVCVLCLSWLHLGCPRVAPAELFLGAPLTKEQWASVNQLSPGVTAWNSNPPVDSEAMGRSAAKIESVEGLLRDIKVCLGSSPGVRGESDEASSVPGALESLAKPVDPGRVKFAGIPSFDPRPFLDSAACKHYEFPISQCTVDPPRSAPPRVSVRCSTSAALQLLEKLDSGDRLALLPERSIPAGRECGLFSVPKSALKDRMVLDARRRTASPTLPKALSSRSAALSNFSTFLFPMIVW